MKFHSLGISSLILATTLLSTHPALAARLPDVVVTSISMSPASPKAGDVVTLKAVVKNQGTKSTPAGVVIGVQFLVDGQTVSWSDTYSKSLAVGASVTLTANSGPAGSAAFKATAGTHQVMAWVNDINRFTESNVSNNTRAKSVNFIGVIATPTPAPSPAPPAKPTVTPSPTPAATATPTPTPKPTVTPTPIPAPTAIPIPPSSGGMKPQNSCLPFQEYATEALRAKPKKAFAHYFYPFPLSIDNQPSANDYYAVNYLNPFGEGSKFLEGGGFIRARPLLMSPLADQNNYWRTNLQKDIRRAIAMGLDGFSFNIMDTKGEGWDIALALLDAAKAVDPKFRIMLMPDMTAISLDQVDVAVAGFYNHPSAFKMDDGRLVMTPFYAEGVTPAQWSTKVSQLKTKGYNVALIPLGLSLPESFLKNYASVAAGFSDWGPRDEGNAANMVNQGALIHKYAGIYMAPVAPNDVRPKDLSYYESHNSGSFRNLWMSAINGNADWVQLVTWNDYSEHTHFSPSLGQKGEMQRTYYDLSSFYLTWFKMGAQPEITNEMLYYFHRRHKSNLQPANKTKQTGTHHIEYGTPYDEIEVVAFLKSAGRVEITTGSKTTGMDMPAGINVFRVPMDVGVPSFKLIRNGAAVISFKSQTEILSSIETSDYTYQSGSASASGTCYTFPEP